MEKYLIFIFKLVVNIICAAIIINYVTIEKDELIVVLLSMILFFIIDFNLELIKNRIKYQKQKNIDKTWDE